ncbi:AMP-binding protein, partial [Clostridium perfringens]
PPSSDDRNHDVRIAIGAVHGLPPHIPEQFTSRYNIPLVNLYGLTEAGGAMLTSNRERVNSSNGKPYGWVDIQIMDEEGAACSPGET